MLLAEFSKVLMVSLLLMTSVVNAQVNNGEDLNLNNLRMTNRAQCALDSDLPTESVFMIVDGYNAGKLAHNLGKSVGADPNSMSLKAMQDFRRSVSRLTTTIIQKVSSGALPLLPLNLKKSTLINYNTLTAKCSNKSYCPELNTYLAKLWDNSNGAGVPWEKIDNFTAAHFLKWKKTDRGSCLYLKRFSPLQAHLHTPEVNEAILQDVAQAYLEKDKYVTNCESEDSALDSRNAILQMDLKIGNNVEEFSRKGFNFWNSVKIYLSFAWRYSDVASQVSPQFGELFKSIALEESLMMMPNGCKSIEKPECDAETLSMNSLRELAKPDGATKAEAGKEVPNGPEQGALQNGPRGVNDDFLGTRGYEDASEWVENFRKNYVQTRGSMKNRVQSAIQFFNILMASMSADELAEYVRPLALTSSFTAQHRDELYYLCTEARLAGDQRIDFMRTGIDKVKEMSVMQKAFDGSVNTLPAVTGFFDSLAARVLPFCEHLEQQNIWNVPDYTVNRSGFNSWARELLNIPPPNTIVPENKPLSFGPPLLIWNAERGEEAGNVICISGIDCVRKVTKAMVDLYSVAKYADAFLPVSSTVPSPDVFNPYAELKACKVYDPWFATRRANKRLFADLSSTALFGWNPLPLYVDIDFKAPKVTSLNQLIQDGIVKFDSKVERSKMESSLLADFGPLVGAPCAVSIAPNSAKDFNFYAFNGISVNYCSIKSDGNSVGSSGGNVENSTPVSRSYCGGCSINFVGVTSGVASSSGMTLNPIKLGIYFFRAIDRFLTAKKDKVNIPKAYEVNLKKVVQTYQDYGKIPAHCVDQLGQGFGCYQNICTAKAADFFERYTGGKIKAISMFESGSEPIQGSYAKTVYIQSNLCRGEIRMNFNCSEDGKSFYTFEHFGGMFGETEECRDAIGQNKWGF